jgi:hypothetical protein
MLEYLYDAIRATAGSELQITAKVFDDLGKPIVEGCEFVLHINDESIITIGGSYEGDTWVFTIPAEFTKGLKGRYWYCIKHGSEQLCFMQAIYLV